MRSTDVTRKLTRSASRLATASTATSCPDRWHGRLRNGCGEGRYCGCTAARGRDHPAPSCVNPGSSRTQTAYPPHTFDTPAPGRSEARSLRLGPPAAEPGIHNGPSRSASTAGRRLSRAGSTVLTVSRARQHPPVMRPIFGILYDRFIPMFQADSAESAESSQYLDPLLGIDTLQTKQYHLPRPDSL